MSDMRDDLEASIVDDEPQETLAETRESAGEKPVGDIGTGGEKFEGSNDSPDPKKTAQELGDKPAAKAAAAPESKPAEAPKAPTGSKAPASWKPAEREGWDALPEHVKTAVNRREQEIQNNLQQTSMARNVAKQFQDLVMPYKPVFDAEGVQNPMQGIQSLLQVAAGLRMGSKQQKALEVAKIIQGYDVDIGALDDLLSGQMPSRENSQIEDLINQRLAPVDQLLSQLQQGERQQQQNQVHAATQSIAEFAPTHEFLNEVRTDMADLMDMASQRGQRMTLEQAYQKACALNPEISQVLEQRQQQQRLQQAAQRAAQKKNASSSIQGTQGGAGGGSGDMDLRSQLEETWGMMRG